MGAFTVADVFVDWMFAPEFAELCDAADWSGQNAQHSLCQLHQWLLWHQELGLPCMLSPQLRKRCLAAFRRSRSSPSQMQREVFSTLENLGARPEEDVIIKDGYSVDVLVFWQGQKIAIDVDEPGRFLGGDAGRTASGNTLLRRRQLSFMGWRPIKLPYWEWDAIDGTEA